MKHIVVRLLAIFVTLATCGAVARRSSRRKSPELGIYRRKTQLMNPPVPRGFVWHFASLGTWKDKTSPSITGIRRGRPIGPPSLRPSWCVSRSISS